MNVLAVHGIKRMGRETVLFEDVSFNLNEGEKVALIGKNGTGKSTLLSCITEKLNPDEGEIIIAKNANIVFLEQNPKFNPQDTIREHIFKSNTASLQIINEYRSVCESLSLIENENNKQSSIELTQSLEKLSLKMDENNLWNYENEIKSVLTTLGINNLNIKMSSLSGGMIKKVALAQILIEDSKIILLDEPTNHLDIPTIEWLEEWLINTKKSVLMVTHDRYFLSNVCSSIYEIEKGKLNHYVGNFDYYLEKKEEEETTAIKQDARIESVLRKEREWLRRGPKARRGKSRARVDNIHKMISREKFSHDKGFTFEVSGRRLGGKVLEVKDISKSWGKNQKVIEGFSYTFKRGEKIGVFGENGSGKTTLLKLLLEKVKSDSGSREVGVNTVFAYFEQNPVFENKEQTVLEYVKESAENIVLKDGGILTAAFLLERFGFTGRVQHSSIMTLSGGERKRVYLVRLLMSNPNFLVLDEPTNDFDIYTLSVLEAFLENYEGCLLVVSHDRYFMDRVAETLFILDGSGAVSGFVGSCSEYLELEKELKAEEREKELKEKDKNKEKPSIKKEVKKTKLSYKEQKEYEAIEGEIEVLEIKIEDLEKLMSSGEGDHEKIRILASDYEKACKELEEKFFRWEYLASFEE